MGRARGGRAGRNSQQTRRYRRREGGHWRTVESGTGKWAAHALVNLLHILQWGDNDLDRVREAYRRAVQTGNPDAPHGLICIGQMLKDRGNAEGAHAAFEQARADGADDELIPEGF